MFDGERVDVGELVVFAFDFFFDQVVLAVVVEDDVHFFGGVAADVWPEHDVVGGLAVELFWVEVGWEEFYVPSAAVNLLIVLNRELDSDVFTSITESVKLGGPGIKFSVLTSSETFVVFVGDECTGVKIKCSVVVFVFGLDPSRFPGVSVAEVVFEVGVGESRSREER